MRSRSLLIAAMLLLPIQASAQDSPAPTALRPLIGAELDSAFRAATMDGVYKTARERSGTHKFTENFNADGTTDYFEGPIVDTGQWDVVGPLLCFRYDGALAGGVSCFNVFQSGTCIYSYNPANIGEDGYPLNETLWSVKTIIRGDISTCDDLVS